MKKVLLVLGLITGISASYTAQRVCGSMEYLEYQIQNDAKRLEKMERIERHTENFTDHPAQRSVNGVINIPVVVHVVYNTASENISDAQIQSQLNVLNADFRRLNSDASNVWSQAQDSQIEFCLASVDQSGNATTGITRTSTSMTSFGTNDQMKFNSSGGKDAWNSSKYMNIWVCDISGGILGYAQFPGGSASTDGVVIDYQYFGTIGTASAPFDLGRTATHEVGHWLNLRHIWGDGGCTVDDFISDTPSSDAANYGCAIGHVSCGTTDMVQNYMDYSDDACMNLFTAGQNVRMRALFDTAGARASLLTSAACGSAPPTATCSDGIQNGQETGVDCGGPSCSACSCIGTSITVSITFDNYPEETSWNLKNSSGATVASGGTYASQADGSTLNISLCLPSGCYDFTISDTYGDGICCSYGNGSYSITGPSGTLVSGSTFTTSATTNFCVGAPPAPTCNDGIQNGNETGVDCGGPLCSPCGGTGCTYGTVNTNTFESSWGIWTDGGRDCARVTTSAYSYSGSKSIRIRDNTTTSLTTTSSLNLSSYQEVTIEFFFYAYSMESGEDFWLQYSTNGGSTYTTVKAYVSGSMFNNGAFYTDQVVIAGPFSSTTRFRFRNDASDDSDLIHLDDITITGCNGTASILIDEESVNNAVISRDLGQESMEFSLYPNPVNDRMNVSIDLNQKGVVNVFIIDMQGRMISNENRNLSSGMNILELNTAEMEQGSYILVLNSATGTVNKRFAVQH
jgi:hypothetical protein